MNAVDLIRSPLRRLHAAFARPQSYTPQGGAAVTLAAWIRGVRDDDLFAAAIQGDKAAVIDAQAFKDATGRNHPVRFDRLRVTGGSSYSVEAWRGSPDDDAPVYFKLLLRGGAQ